MKNFRLFAAALVLGMAVLCSCSKDGEDGKDGAQGAQGPQGIAGNAGVTMYTFGERTVTNGLITYNIPIDFGYIKNYAVYAYVFTTAVHWTLVPGVLNASCNINAVLIKGDPGTTGYRVSILKYSDGTFYTTPVIFTAFRIVVVPVPEGNIIEAKGGAIDFGSYAEVAKRYGLPE